MKWRFRLKITAEKNQESQYVVTIEVEPAELESAKAKAVKRFSNSLRIPGFRPGKAPRVIVERMVGQEALIEEATKELLPKAYKEALENKDIKPIADPEVNIESFNPLTIIAKIPVEPTVILGDYRNLRYEKTVAEVTDEDVEKTIQRTVDQKTTWEDLEEERSAQIGDKVELTLQTLRDGEPVGEPFNRTGELGKGEILEQLDEQVAGMTVGKERTIEILRKPSKPADVAEEETAAETEPEPTEEAAPEAKVETGETATEDAIAETPEVETIPLTAEEEEQQGLRPLVFKVKLDAIKKKNAPELTDEFTEANSTYKTVTEWREGLAKSLKATAENNAKREVTDQIVKALVEQSHFELPHVLIHAEAHALEEQFEENLKQSKLNLNTYMQYTNKTREDFHEEMHVQAETRLRTALALREVAQVEGIAVAGDELDRAVEKTVERYTSTLPEDTRNESAEQLRQIFGGEENRRQIQDDLFSRKLAQRLLEIATGEAPEAGTPVILEDEEEPIAATNSVEAEQEEEPIAATSSVEVDQMEDTNAVVEALDQAEVIAATDSADEEATEASSDKETKL